MAKRTSVPVESHFSNSVTEPVFLTKPTLNLTSNCLDKEKLDVLKVFGTLTCILAAKITAQRSCPNCHRWLHHCLRRHMGHPRVGPLVVLGSGNSRAAAVHDVQMPNNNGHVMLLESSLPNNLNAWQCVVFALYAGDFLDPTATDGVCTIAVRL